MNLLHILLFTFIGITGISVLHILKDKYLTKKISIIIDIVFAIVLSILTVFFWITLTKGNTLNIILLVVWLSSLFDVSFAVISSEYFIQNEQQNHNPYKKAQKKNEKITEAKNQ